MVSDCDLNSSLAATAGRVVGGLALDNILTTDVAAFSTQFFSKDQMCLSHLCKWDDPVGTHTMKRPGAKQNVLITVGFATKVLPLISAEICTTGVIDSAVGRRSCEGRRLWEI